MARRSSCSSISLSLSKSPSSRKLPASLPELLGNDLNLNKPEDSGDANEKDQQTKVGLPSKELQGKLLVNCLQSI